MGQYYKPIALDENSKPKAWVYSHAIKETRIGYEGKPYEAGSGLKLMEHSWMKNNFVAAFESLLIKGAPHYKSGVVWAGDYADPEDDSVITEYEDNLLKEEYGDDCRENGVNLYKLANDNTQVTPKIPNKKPRYLVNHTKGEFVDKYKVPKDASGWQIHPLPLLTCEGNNRGGGDFRVDENNPNHVNADELIGRWSRDVISAEFLKKDVPKGFNRLNLEYLRNKLG